MIWIDREVTSGYAYDIASEGSNEYASRLVEECIENGYISEDDLTEDKDYKGEDELAEVYIERHMEEMESRYSTFGECIANEHGDFMLDNMIKHDPSLLNIGEIAERCRETDGYGLSLARWDGATIETADFYAFKQADGDNRSLVFLQQLEKQSSGKLPFTIDR